MPLLSVYFTSDFFFLQIMLKMSEALWLKSQMGYQRQLSQRCSTKRVGGVAWNSSFKSVSDPLVKWAITWRVLKILTTNAKELNKLNIMSLFQVIY